MSVMSSVITPAMLRAINQPVTEARGLPREAYTDPGFLALERAHVFDASWVFVAAAESIPDGTVNLVDHRRNKFLSQGKHADSYALLATPVMAAQV